jgi:CDP-diacylglycerol--glycerol-3-phosphate 3-phosphatidyltransferase
MIARDVVVDASRMHAASKNVVVAANIHGKLKTVAQMVGIIVIFFLFNMTSDYTVYYYGVQNLMIYVALLFSIVSGVIYLCNIYKKPKSEVVQ